MPRASNGVYTLPNTVNPVVTNTTITSNWANTTLADIESVLTSCLDRAGRGAMQANLQMGGFKVTGAAEGTAGTDLVTKGQMDAVSVVVATKLDASAVSAFGLDLIDSADAAAARTALDVPSRTGADASGTWDISISGNAATASNADQLDGIDSTGFTRSTGISELGSGARTTSNVPGSFGGKLSLRNAGGGGNTATSLEAILHGINVGDLIFTDTGDGGCAVDMTYTPPGDPNTDRRVFVGFRLRTDGICVAKGFLPADVPVGIGSYMLAWRAGGSPYGGNVAGSELRDGGFSRAGDSVAVINYFGTGLPGTWKSLATTGSGSTGSFGLYIRIA